MNHDSYKYGICGGMPLRESVAAQWTKLTGVIPVNCMRMVSVPSVVTSATVIIVTVAFPLTPTVKFPFNDDVISELFIKLSVYGTAVPLATLVVTRVKVVCCPSLIVVGLAERA